MKFVFGSNTSSADDPPRSPKFMYTTPSPNAHSNTNITDLASSTLISSGNYEQRSPKYLSYEHQLSPRRSPKMSNKFVFDAVSPRRESIGNLLVMCHFFFIFIML